jgi:hypothetical protein
VQKYTLLAGIVYAVFNPKYFVIIAHQVQPYACSVQVAVQQAIVVGRVFVVNITLIREKRNKDPDGDVAELLNTEAVQENLI